MTENTLRQIVHRAVKDGSFRAQLQRDPARALAGFDLTADDRSAIASGDPARLTALGVDQRMSRAFGTGVLGDASKAIDIDATGALGGSRAFLDEGTAAGTLGIVGDPIARTAAVVEPSESAAQLHMRLVEQDLDVGAAVAAEPAGEKYLTEDEALSAYYASLAAASSAESANAQHLRMIEQDLDAGAAVDFEAGPSRLQMIEQDLDVGANATVDSGADDLTQVIIQDQPDPLD